MQTGEITRRELLIGSSVMALGALSSSAHSAFLPNSGGVGFPLPWPYKKIDPQEAASISYNGFYTAACCYGTAKGILMPLQRLVGEPYTLVPLPEAIASGRGGIAGWGTTCGALVGAAVVAGFIAPLDAAESIIRDLFHWFGETSFPIYEPVSAKNVVRTRSASNSPLCHIAAGKWCKKAGKPFKHPEREEWCARLTADVTAQAVTLLNSWSEGTLGSGRRNPRTVYGAPAQYNCLECHSGGVPEMKKP